MGGVKGPDERFANGLCEARREIGAPERCLLGGGERLVDLVGDVQNGVPLRVVGVGDRREHPLEARPPEPVVGEERPAPVEHLPLPTQKNGQGPAAVTRQGLHGPAARPGPP